MIGELVSGSIAQPAAVTLLGPVVTASIEPKGFPLFESGAALLK